MEVKTCKRKKCGKPFKPNKPKQQFCSDKCRVYFSREQVKEAVTGNTKPANKARILKERQIPSKVSGSAKNPLTRAQCVEVPPKKEASHKPKNLEELKALCPAELTGFDRSTWIAENRQKYNI